MANVMLSDVIIPDVYLSYGADDNPEKSEYAKAGVAVRTPRIQEAANADGLIAHMPFWLDLDPTVEPNYDTDNVNDVAVPNKIGSGDIMTRKAFMNQGYSAADLVNEIIGSNPMQRIRARFGAYWLRQFNRRLLAISSGILADNIANHGADMVNNVAIADGVHATSANVFNRGVFTTAAFTMGDRFEDMTAMIVHSIIYKRMIDNDDIAFIQPSQGEMAVPTFLGRRVIVDDSMPVVAGGVSGYIYTSILFGRGVIGYAEGMPKVPVEIYRRPDQANGGGMETLWERKQWLIHPLGYKWNEASLSGQSPTFADLRNPVNWTRQIERKNIPIAFIVTNG